MAATNKMPLFIFYILGCLIFPIWGLARVDNRTNWRAAANTTRPNTINQGWKSPSAAPTTTQWGRNNQTSTAAQNWQRNNNTQHFPGNNQHHGYQQQPQNAVGFGAPTPNVTTYAPRPQFNNPWMRNNQSSQPHNPQQTIGWGGRPNATGPPANNNFGTVQPNWNRTQPSPWTNPQHQPIGGWNGAPRPSYNGTASVNSGSGYSPRNNFGFNFGQPDAYPQIQPNAGWNGNGTSSFNAGSTPTNNFGSSFGQSNFNRTLPNTSIGASGVSNPQSPPASGWIAGKPTYNGTFPGFNPPPQSQPDQAFGGGWNPGYNAGQTPPAAPLAPVGGHVAPIGFGGAAPLAPLGGGGGQASLSYANGQQLPVGQQKPVGGNTNPYANLFN